MPRLTTALQRGFLFVSGRENRWGAADGRAKRQSAGGSVRRKPAGGSVRRQPAGTDSNRRAQTVTDVHRQQAAGALILAERGVV